MQVLMTKINNYEQFVDEIIELQGLHEKETKGDWLAISLNRKRKILKKHGISLNENLWNVPLQILNEIIVEIKRS